jgi:hypothetical protein
MAFTVSGFEYLGFPQFCSDNRAASEECYYNSGGHYQLGLQLHLGGILPGAFLACFQFTPIIRHKLIHFHRINGVITILLNQVGVAGAFMIARRSFGGTHSTQVGIGMLAILFESSMFLAYYNIKRLQIDQHRAWMLRTSAYRYVNIQLFIII